jgi:hypothetical protein
MPHASLLHVHWVTAARARPVVTVAFASDSSIGQTDFARVKSRMQKHMLALAVQARLRGARGWLLPLLGS